ncbi:MAG TPA: sortase [Candidatus Limnocylindrales bacterium]|nr:sortase [Candidatus Limnocylindrales bacterium]
MPLLVFVRDRLVPALLAAVGVALLGAGLLTYTTPAVAGDPGASAPPGTAVLPSPSPSPLRTPTPSAGPSASPSPTAPAERAFATRVVVPALRIDMPVMPGPDTYPPCNVAMFIRELGQPGEPAATYLYAHARTGMFLPLLTESRRNEGARMIGMLVQVYSSDDRLHLYEITEVRPTQTSLDDAIRATSEELWLQTSEGPRGTVGKLQVIAKPLSVGPADPAESHPVPKPVACA